jgi:hypothetical protein
LLVAPQRSKADVERRLAALRVRRELFTEVREQMAIVPDPDTPDELEFIASLKIEDKVSGGLIPFDLWDCQRDLVEQLRDNSRLLALKSRQLGVTWTALAHLLYLGTFWGDRLFLIASQSGDDAIDALHRLRILHTSIPLQWRPEMTKNNTEEMAFANGSRYESGKATRRYGRSKAPYAILADEIAFWEWAADQFASLDAAERIYAVTTGNGPDDYTHKLWRGAEAGEGRWKTVFYPWSAHPGRDEDWYRLNVIEAPEPRLAHREYAATPEEAFAAPEGIYFQRWSEVNKVAVKPQHNWDTWRVVDFGFHWPACLWVQESPSGQPIVVAELAGREPFDWTTEEFADNILAKEKEFGLVVPVRATFCDPAGKGVNPQTGESEFAVFQAKGLVPIGQTSSVRDGCVRIIDAISDPSLPLLVSDACPWLREALGSVAPDKHKPDIYNDDSVYDHVLDTLRYYFINRVGKAPDYDVPDPTPGPSSGLWGKAW